VQWTINLPYSHNISEKCKEPAWCLAVNVNYRSAVVDNCYNCKHTERCAAVKAGCGYRYWLISHVTSLRSGAPSQQWRKIFLSFAWALEGFYHASFGFDLECRRVDQKELDAAGPGLAFFLAAARLSCLTVYRRQQKIKVRPVMFKAPVPLMRCTLIISPWTLLREEPLRQVLSKKLDGTRSLPPSLPSGRALILTFPRLLRSSMSASLARTASRPVSCSASLLVLDPTLACSTHTLFLISPISFSCDVKSAQIPDTSHWKLSCRASRSAKRVSILAIRASNFSQHAVHAG